MNNTLSDKEKDNIIRQAIDEIFANTIKAAKTPKEKSQLIAGELLRHCSLVKKYSISGIFTKSMFFSPIHTPQHWNLKITEEVLVSRLLEHTKNERSI